MKRAGIATSEQLSEYSLRKAQLGFHDHMHQVVRHELVVTGSRIHFEVGKRRAPDLDCVPSLTGAPKHDDHFGVRLLH